MCEDHVFVILIFQNSGRADFRGSALAYIIIQFPDMSNRAGLASPALPETAYNPDNRSSKKFPAANGSVPNPVGVQSIFS